MPPFFHLSFKLSSAHAPNFRSSQSSVVATFTPILKAYIYAGYQQSAVIQGEITTPVIWTQNLASLGPYTSWTLARDPSSGIYTITPDPNVDGQGA